MLSQKVIMLPPLPGLRSRKLSSTWEWLKFHPTTRRWPHAAAPRAQLVPHDNILRVVQAWQGSGRYLGRYGKFSHFLVENEPFTGEK